MAKRKSAKQLLEELRINREWAMFRPRLESMSLMDQVHLLHRVMLRQSRENRKLA